VLPDLVQEARGRTGVAAVHNNRFPDFWTKADDAFAQARDYPRPGALLANPFPPPRGSGCEGVPGGLPNASHRLE